MKIKRRSFIQSISATIAAFTIGVSVAYPSTKKVEVKLEEEKKIVATPCIELLDKHIVEGTGPWKDWELKITDRDSWVYATPEFIEQLEWEIRQANDLATPWRKFDGLWNPARLMFCGRPFRPHNPGMVQVETDDGSVQHQESLPKYFYEFIDGHASLSGWHDLWVHTHFNLICKTRRRQGHIVAPDPVINYRPTQLNQGERKWSLSKT